MSKSLDDTRSEFIEKIGVIYQQDGNPRIAGRLLGLLIWEGEAISFSGLADQLQVSRGSISTASRILEERRLIRRTAKAGERQDYFQLADRPYGKMLEMVAAQLNQAEEEISNTLNDIPKSEAGLRKRVAAHSDIYKRMSGAVAGVIPDLD